MYELLRTIHLIAVSPCLIIGAYLIYASTKGSKNHKKLGWIYMILMFFQAGVSLFMEARVGPQIFKSFRMDSSPKYSDFIYRSKKYLLY